MPKKSLYISVSLFGLLFLLQITGVLPYVGSFVQKAASPVLSLSRKAGSSTGEFFGAFFKISTLSKENAELRDQLATMAGKLAQLKDVEKQNEVYLAQLKVEETKGWTMLPARVLSFSGAGFEDVLLLDKGKKHGVKDGMVVVFENNLVGTVFRADEFTSSMRIVTNPNSAILARVSERKATGVVRGKLGTGILGMDEIELGEKIATGDLVVTSKISKEMPAGLALGLIEDIRSDEDAVFQYAKVRPIVDMGKLDIVFVVLSTERQ